jgi:hypothetical protein
MLGAATAWTNPISAGIAIAGVVIPMLIGWAKGDNASEQMADLCNRYLGGGLPVEDAHGYIYNLGFEEEGSRSGYWEAWDILMTPVMIDYLYQKKRDALISKLTSISPDRDYPGAYQAWLTSRDGTPMNKLFLDYMTSRKSTSSSMGGSRGSESYYRRYFEKAVNLDIVGLLPDVYGNPAVIRNDGGTFKVVDPTPPIQSQIGGLLSSAGLESLARPS